LDVALDGHYDLSGLDLSDFAHQSGITNSRKCRSPDPSGGRGGAQLAEFASESR